MNSMYRKMAGVALAGALLCGTAACTGEDDKASPGGKAASSAPKPVEVTPAAAIKRAAEKNEKITSLTYSMSGKVPGDGSMKAQASMSMKPLALQMKMEGGTGADSGEVEIRVVGGAMYMNGGEPLEPGKNWMKFDLAALKKAGGEDPMAGLSRQAEQNPAKDSAALTASKDLKKVGEETIDGVKTTHYSGTLTLDAMRDSLKGEDAATRKSREQSLKDYEKLGAKSLTMDMWIDENDQTKQFRTRSTTDKGPLDVVIKFLAVNKPVTVKAPSPGETVDLAEMMKDAEGA
ncbi:MULTISPECIES: LppX_LprAFG lipoprotein [unclassified Streptomyces]|uniref:LppX_LprAFG lipoprotein n=1 Tax=unclassified Streptomyces TaxID=2593676 RepID=UPI00364D5635